MQLPRLLPSSISLVSCCSLLYEYLLNAPYHDDLQMVFEKSLQYVGVSPFIHSILQPHLSLSNLGLRSFLTSLLQPFYAFFFCLWHHPSHPSFIGGEKDHCQLLQLNLP